MMGWHFLKIAENLEKISGGERLSGDRIHRTVAGSHGVTKSATKMGFFYGGRWDTPLDVVGGGGAYQIALILDNASFEAGSHEHEFALANALI
jgi:hypothetical protein